MSGVSEREKDAVDLVTNNMITLDFLEQLTLAIRSPLGPTISVAQFYNDWLSQRQLPEHKPPFNLGVIAGYLYVGLLLTKENWADLIPSDRIDALGPEWGLTGVSCLGTDSNPPVAQFVRRVRNAMGHARFAFRVPPEFTPQNVHDTVTVTFEDVNTRNPSDRFGVTLKLVQVEKLIKEFQGRIHKSVRTQAGITGPQRP